MDNDILDLDIDNSYIEEFEKLEQFYRAPLEYVTIHYAYIDNTGALCTIKKDTAIINENTLKNDQLVYIIKKHITLDSQKYKLFSILKYNIIIDHNELLSNLETYGNKNFSSTDLEVINQLRDIQFEDTIKCFHDLNSIIIFYYDPQTIKHTHNVDVNINNESKHRVPKNKTTRKIYIQSSKGGSKRTRKHYRK
jgi:hypothetical protein